MCVGAYFKTNEELPSRSKRVFKRKEEEEKKNTNRNTIGTTKRKEKERAKKKEATADQLKTPC